MRDHVRILGILYIVYSLIGVAVGVVLLAVFGGIAGIISFANSTDPDARFVGPILGIVAGLLFLILTVLSLPGIIAGVGLLKLKPWSRILTIVLSAMHLMSFPVGTAIGAYGLWVLLNQESASLFESRP